MADNIDPVAALWPDMAQSAPQPRAVPRAQSAPAPAPAEPEKSAAEILWPDMVKDEQAPEPKHRIVAKTNAAKSAQERLYPNMPQDSATEDAGADDKSALASGAATLADGIAEVIQLSPTLEVRAPQGFEAYNEASLEVFAPIAERLKMDKEDAQTLIDLHAKALTENTQDLIKYQLDEMNKIEQDYAREAKADPELRSGPGFNTNLQNAKTILKRYGGGGALQSALKLHGLASNPEMLKFLVRVNNALSRRRS